MKDVIDKMFHYIDLMGTFVFAISGALAGIHRRFDIFGVFVVAFITACGGGILRDICIGSFPPVGLIDSEYFILIILAVLLCVFFQTTLLKLTQPTLFFDAIGLGFFAAFGVHKTYILFNNVELSLILGCVTAVGGGILRDILLGHVPTILRKEIYASAALVGAWIQLIGERGGIDPHLSVWIAILSCSAIRLLSLRYKINLPSIKQSGS